MRWELSQPHGLAALREALGELHEAGFTASGVGYAAETRRGAGAPRLASRLAWRHIFGQFPE
jgi:hypothetical protein